MQVSDFYIRREARRLIELYGEQAIAEARSRVASHRASDDMLAADTWLRIIAAMEELLREETT
jgi:hypothetical protein